MIKHGWEYQFRDIILIRGMEYYRERLVDQIIRTDRGWKAVVHGSEDYTVEITEENGKVKSMQCSCPYAEGGRNCKHEAAVLFALSEKEAEDEEEDSSEEETIEEIIDAMSEEALREELKRIVSEDGHIRDRIYSRYRRKKAGREEVTRIYQILDSLAYECGDRYGFIDWRAGSEYVSEFTSCLEDAIVPLIDNEEYMIAFEALERAFFVLNKVEMDGSGGEHTTIANEIYDYWTDVIHHADEAERDEMHQRLEDLSENSEEMICSDTIDELLENAFDDPKYLDPMLEEIRSRLNDPNLSDNEMEHLLDRYEDLLRRRGSDQSERELWLSQHEDRLPVKKIRYASALDRNNIPEQIRILEGIISGDIGSWEKQKYRRELLDLYKGTGETKKEKALLDEILFRDRVGDLDYYRRLRSISDPGFWPKKRAAYLDMHPESKAEIYCEEKMYDELMDALKTARIDVVDQYLDAVKDRYPKEVLQLYINHLNRQLNRHASASVYAQIEKYTKIAASLKGGRSEMLFLIDQWIRDYPTRKALVSRLQKLKKELC